MILGGKADPQPAPGGKLAKKKNQSLRDTNLLVTNLQRACATSKVWAGNWGPLAFKL